MDNQTFRDFFLGFIKIHILYHAAKEPIYGQEFANELNRHGYKISFGTLYPIFHRLEQKGLLIAENKNVKGKVRKYYFITEKGNEILTEARLKAKDLVDELFEN
ncbi:helix-turn-helix transcriptional regulator [candidate division KSB1 bacterium]|nr:helix-turn-helix transcriptional regulator [candidate division KSB1 bacterium]